MRIAVLTVLALLAAGCSLTNDKEPHAVQGAQAAAPSAAAPFAAVDAWVQAAAPADPARFGTVTKDGKSTPLKGDVSFTSPSGKIKCTSDFREGLQGLNCLVDLKNPPKRPEGDSFGNWVGNWIDYSGTTLTVGSFHGDPGPFIYGYGAELPYGNRVGVKDYTCRVDADGLVCVDAAAKSAARISDAGVVPFGCLREHADPKVKAGQSFRC
ncbi:hypothetical protein BJY24_000919 [Nocardia transvalensis]|uniref:Lipoprotein LppI n=1 Tax=Nocardia transvalensis TaxID=37333 RepID=A0A7W9P9K9_9NOCA|nr:hypothetical protein [Nocardia transvalensis]MBB5912052.1 hypothetical protein [Nocardia transvalensis]